MSAYPHCASKKNCCKKSCNCHWWSCWGCSSRGPHILLICVSKRTSSPELHTRVTNIWHMHVRKRPWTGWLLRTIGEPLHSHFLKRKMGLTLLLTYKTMSFCRWLLISRGSVVWESEEENGASELDIAREENNQRGTEPQWCHRLGTEKAQARTGSHRPPPQKQRFIRKRTWPASEGRRWSRARWIEMGAGDAITSAKRWVTYIRLWG